METISKMRKELEKKISKGLSKTKVVKKDHEIAKGVQRFPKGQSGPKGWKPYAIRSGGNDGVF